MIREKVVIPYLVSSKNLSVHENKKEMQMYLLMGIRKILQRGVVAGGRRSSVAERWQLKPEALDSTPGGATFLSCPMPFQRSTDSDGPDCVFQLDTIGLRTMEESRPSDSSPCCDYACDLSYINYAHSNQL